MLDTGRSAGFTLIETLVALVIFVAGYVLVYQSIALGWRGAMIAHGERQAVRLAQARLATAGVEAPLSEGLQSGETADGYSWTLQVRGYRPPGQDGSGSGSLSGFWVVVDVTWAEGTLRRQRSVQLATLRLGVRR